MFASVKRRVFASVKRQAYFGTKLITTIKSFIGQARCFSVIDLFSLSLTMHNNKLVFDSSKYLFLLEVRLG